MEQIIEAAVDRGSSDLHLTAGDVRRAATSHFEVSS